MWNVNKSHCMMNSCSYKKLFSLIDFVLANIYYYMYTGTFEHASFGYLQCAMEQRRKLFLERQCIKYTVFLPLFISNTRNLPKMHFSLKKSIYGNYIYNFKMLVLKT